MPPEPRHDALAATAALETSPDEDLDDSCLLDFGTADPTAAGAGRRLGKECIGALHPDLVVPVERGCPGRGGQRCRSGIVVPAGDRYRLEPAGEISGAARRDQPRRAVGRSRQARRGARPAAPVYDWFTEGFDTADLKTPGRYSTSWHEGECSGTWVLAESVGSTPRSANILKRHHCCAAPWRPRPQPAAPPRPRPRRRDAERSASPRTP